MMPVLGLQSVSGYYALLYYMLAQKAYSGSSACEYLLCLAIFHACS